MKIRERSYPHPVIRSDNDDVDASFQAPIQVRKVGEFFEIEILLQMSSDDLRSMIESGNAAYGLHVECTRSFFRELYLLKPKNGRAVVSVGLENLRGPVELNVLVYATREIANYKIDGFHEDYGSKSFYVSAGDYLAITEGATFNAEIHQDMLESIRSFIELVKRSDSKELVSVNWNSDRIQIWLPTADYDLFCKLRKSPSFSFIQLSSIILPVLMQALDIVAKADPDYEGNRWYHNLLHRLTQRNLPRDSNSFESAQILLDYPIRTTLEKVYEKTQESVDEE